jgi:hypothetical protein
MSNFIVTKGWGGNLTVTYGWGAGTTSFIRPDFIPDYAERVKLLFITEFRQYRKTPFVMTRRIIETPAPAPSPSEKITDLPDRAKALLVTQFRKERA